MSTSTSSNAKTAAPSKIHGCSHVAGADTKKKLQCSACKTVLYCSAECQRTDWDQGHRYECIEMKRGGGWYRERGDDELPPKMRFRRDDYQAEEGLRVLSEAAVQRAEQEAAETAALLEEANVSTASLQEGSFHDILSDDLEEAQRQIDQLEYNFPFREGDREAQRQYEDMWRKTVMPTLRTPDLVYFLTIPAMRHLAAEGLAKLYYERSVYGMNDIPPDVAYKLAIVAWNLERKSGLAVIQTQKSIAQAMHISTDKLLRMRKDANVPTKEWSLDTVLGYMYLSSQSRTVDAVVKQLASFQETRDIMKRRQEHSRMARRDEVVNALTRTRNPAQRYFESEADKTRLFRLFERMADSTMQSDKVVNARRVMQYIETGQIPGVNMPWRDFLESVSREFVEVFILAYFSSAARKRGWNFSAAVQDRERFLNLDPEIRMAWRDVVTLYAREKELSRTLIASLNAPRQRLLDAFERVRNRPEARPLLI